MNEILSMDILSIEYVWSEVLPILEMVDGSLDHISFCIIN
jgi:hypothetical protein